MPFLPTSSTCYGGEPSASYYLRSGDALAPGTVLTNPVPIKSTDGSTTANIFVSGAAAGAYQGAINIQPGANAGVPGGVGDGVTIRTTAGPGPVPNVATTVEIGANAQSPNHLYIAGSQGVGEVYDEVYNQPVSLQPITQVQTAPLLTPANPEEVLRCGQPAIAAAIANPGSQFNIFTVPRSGAYMIQTEIAVGNQGVVPPQTVVIPSTIVGGVPIWESISLSFAVQGGSSVPYASFEAIGGDFYGDQAFTSQSFITKTFTSLAILAAGVNYVVVLNAGAGWNIGSSGQIKTQLIAMC